MEFPAAGAHIADSFWLEHFIILKYFFLFMEIKSFVMLKKVCSNILHNSLFGAPVDRLDYYIIEMFLLFYNCKLYFLIN